MSDQSHDSSGSMMGGMMNNDHADESMMKMMKMMMEMNMNMMKMMEKMNTEKMSTGPTGKMMDSCAKMMERRAEHPDQPPDKDGEP